MELFDKVVDRDETATKSGVPIVKYDDTAPPELFAPFIAYLASDEAAEVNGAVFMCGGGFIARYSNPAVAAVISDRDGLDDGEARDLRTVDTVQRLQEYQSGISSTAGPGTDLPGESVPGPGF